MLRRLLARSTNDWALKLTSFALAFLLWSTVRGDEQMQWDADDIAVRVTSTDPEWVVAEVSPDRVSAVFRGPQRELFRAVSGRPQIILSLGDVSDSVEDHLLRRSLVQMPPGTERTEVADFRPTSIRVVFDRVSTRLIPLAVQLRGQPAAGAQLAGAPVIEPSVVRASGAGRRLSRVDSLRLPVIDLTGRSRTDTLEITIDTTGTGLIISPRTVRIILPLRPDSTLPPLLGGRSGG